MVERYRCHSSTLRNSTLYFSTIHIARLSCWPCSKCFSPFCKGTVRVSDVLFVSEIQQSGVIGYWRGFSKTLMDNEYLTYNSTISGAMMGTFITLFGSFRNASPSSKTDMFVFKNANSGLIWHITLKKTSFNNVVLCCKLFVYVRARIMILRSWERSMNLK